MCATTTSHGEEEEMLRVSNFFLNFIHLPIHLSIIYLPPPSNHTTDDEGT